MFLPKANTLRKGLLLYRRLRYRKGFGVHSPFVFSLITKVIEEKCQYYRFFDIEVMRKKLLFNNTNVIYHDKQNQGKLKSRSVSQIVRREAIKPKHGKLLFRLANYFKSESILQIGSGAGLSTLYLTSYSHNLKCIVLENMAELADIARMATDGEAINKIDIRVGEYRKTLPKAIEEMGNLDLVFFNTQYEQQDNQWLFYECMKHADNETIFVFNGIKDNRKMRELWGEIKSSPNVTVTLDLYSIGIVLFNKKLYKRDYKVFF